MGVVTPSGGACDIISDLAHDYDIELPAFTEQTIEQLHTVLPAFSTAHNPLDVTGYVVVDATLQRRALAVVGNDPNIDFVLNLVSVEGAYEVNPVTLPTTYAQYDNLLETMRSLPCPVVLVANTCVDTTATARLVIERTGLHFVGGIEHGIRAINRLLWWSEWMRTPIAEHEQGPLAVVKTTFPMTGTWSEGQARTLLQNADIPVIPAFLASSEQEAVQAARQVGFPVVLKIQSQTIVHKSDVGGVVLNLADEQAVQTAYTSMIEQVQKQCPDAKLEGVQVSPMRTAGTELLVGIIRDGLWGPVLTLGLGGIWTEVLKDTTLRVLPVSVDEIKTMLSELRGFALLRGERGQAGVDIQALSEVIYRISRLALALGPQLAALEINPLWAREEQIEALDALVSWQ
jgi:acetate---CoA ligase (ADP-forming)